MLVDECLESVREVAGHRRQQAGEPLHGSSEQPGELSQKLFSGGQLGQRLDVVGRQQCAVHQATFDDQRLVGLGELLERLGQHHGVTAGTVGLGRGERERRRPHQLVFDVEAGIACGESSQGVLVHLVVGTGVAQRPAQRLYGRHVETAILGEHRGVGIFQPAPDLFDDRNLLGSGILHCTSSL